MMPDFQYFPLLFEFIARQPLSFPAGKASNTLRGALGLTFRMLACSPECRQLPDTHTCPLRHTCPYARTFEPNGILKTPSGLHDHPRPFVFRARHLDGKTIQSGERFHFHLNLFTGDPEIHRFLLLTFAALAREGLSPARAKVDLINQPALEPVTLSLMPNEQIIQKLRVEFLSPTELKHDGQIVERPEFPVLLARIRDRVGTLQALYGPRPLDLDFRSLGERAQNVRLTACELTRAEAKRRSARTGQVHSIGGFTGFAEYEGDLTGFIPWLRIACHTGVGRQAVWGKGELSIRLQGCGREPW